MRLLICWLFACWRVLLAHGAASPSSAPPPSSSPPSASQLSWIEENLEMDTFIPSTSEKSILNYAPDSQAVKCGDGGSLSGTLGSSDVNEHVKWFLNVVANEWHDWDLKLNDLCRYLEELEKMPDFEGTDLKVLLDTLMTDHGYSGFKSETVWVEEFISKVKALEKNEFTVFWCVNYLEEKQLCDISRHEDDSFTLRLFTTKTDYPVLKSDTRQTNVVVFKGIPQEQITNAYLARMLLASQEQMRSFMAFHKFFDDSTNQYSWPVLFTGSFNHERKANFDTIYYWLAYHWVEAGNGGRSLNDFDKVIKKAAFYLLQGVMKKNSKQAPDDLEGNVDIKGNRVLAHAVQELKIRDIIPADEDILVWFALNEQDVAPIPPTHDFPVNKPDSKYSFKSAYWKIEHPGREQFNIEGSICDAAVEISKKCGNKRSDSRRRCAMKVLFVEQWDTRQCRNWKIFRHWLVYQVLDLGHDLLDAANAYYTGDKDALVTRRNALRSMYEEVAKGGHTADTLLAMQLLMQIHLQVSAAIDDKSKWDKSVPSLREFTFHYLFKVPIEWAGNEFSTDQVRKVQKDLIGEEPNKTNSSWYVFWEAGVTLHPFEGDDANGYDTICKRKRKFDQKGSYDLGDGNSQDYPEHTAEKWLEQHVVAFRQKEIGKKIVSSSYCKLTSQNIGFVANVGKFFATDEEGNSDASTRLKDYLDAPTKDEETWEFIRQLQGYGMLNPLDSSGNVSDVLADKFRNPKPEDRSQFWVECILLSGRRGFLPKKDTGKNDPRISEEFFYLREIALHYWNTLQTLASNLGDANSLGSSLGLSDLQKPVGKLVLQKPEHPDKTISVLPVEKVQYKEGQIAYRTNNQDDKLTFSVPPGTVTLSMKYCTDNDSGHAKPGAEQVWGNVRSKDLETLMMKAFRVPYPMSTQIPGDAPSFPEANGVAADGELAIIAATVNPDVAETQGLPQFMRTLWEIGMHRQQTRNIFVGRLREQPYCFVDPVCKIMGYTFFSSPEFDGPDWKDKKEALADQIQAALDEQEDRLFIQDANRLDFVKATEFIKFVKVTMFAKVNKGKQLRKYAMKNLESQWESFTGKQALGLSNFNSNAGKIQRQRWVLTCTGFLAALDLSDEDDWDLKRFTKGKSSPAVATCFATWVYLLREAESDDYIRDGSTLVHPIIYRRAVRGYSRWAPRLWAIWQKKSSVFDKTCPLLPWGPNQDEVRCAVTSSDKNNPLNVTNLNQEIQIDGPIEDQKVNCKLDKPDKTQKDAANYLCTEMMGVSEFSICQQINTIVKKTDKKYEAKSFDAIFVPKSEWGRGILKCERGKLEIQSGQFKPTRTGLQSTNYDIRPWVVDRLQEMEIVEKTNIKLKISQCHRAEDDENADEVQSVYWLNGLPLYRSTSKIQADPVTQESNIPPVTQEMGGSGEMGKPGSCRRQNYGIDYRKALFQADPDNLFCFFDSQPQSASGFNASGKRWTFNILNFTEKMRPGARGKCEVPLGQIDFSKDDDTKLTKITLDIKSPQHKKTYFKDFTDQQYSWLQENNQGDGYSSYDSSAGYDVFTRFQKPDDKETEGPYHFEGLKDQQKIMVFYSIFDQKTETRVSLRSCADDPKSYCYQSKSEITERAVAQSITKYRHWQKYLYHHRIPHMILMPATGESQFRVFIRLQMIDGGEDYQGEHTQTVWSCSSLSSTSCWDAKIFEFRHDNSGMLVAHGAQENMELAYVMLANNNIEHAFAYFKAVNKGTGLEQMPQTQANIASSLAKFRISYTDPTTQYLQKIAAEMAGIMTEMESISPAYPYYLVPQYLLLDWQAADLDSGDFQDPESSVGADGEISQKAVDNGKCEDKIENFLIEARFYLWESNRATGEVDLSKFNMDPEKDCTEDVVESIARYLIWVLGSKTAKETSFLKLIFFMHTCLLQFAENDPVYDKAKQILNPVFLSTAGMDPKKMTAADKMLWAAVENVERKKWTFKPIRPTTSGSSENWIDGGSTDDDSISISRDSYPVFPVTATPTPVARNAEMITSPLVGKEVEDMYATSKCDKEDHIQKDFHFDEDQNNQMIKDLFDWAVQNEAKPSKVYRVLPPAGQEWDNEIRKDAMRKLFLHGYFGIFFEDPVKKDAACKFRDWMNLQRRGIYWKSTSGFEMKDLRHKDWEQKRSMFNDVIESVDSALPKWKRTVYTWEVSMTLRHGQVRVMREIQWDKLKNEFQEVLAGKMDQNHIFQIMMGEGKTSFLNPLLVSSQKGMVLMSPEAVFTTNKEDMLSNPTNTIDLFGIGGDVLYCSRQPTAGHIKTLGEVLDRAAARNRYLLMTPETAMCFQNLMVVARLGETSDDIKYEDILDILRKLHTRTAVMDEIDDIHNPLHEYNFPLKRKGFAKAAGIFTLMSLAFSLKDKDGKALTRERAGLDWNDYQPIKKQVVDGLADIAEVIFSVKNENQLKDKLQKLSVPEILQEPSEFEHLALVDMARTFWRCKDFIRDGKLVGDGCDAKEDNVLYASTFLDAVLFAIIRKEGNVDYGPSGKPVGDQVTGFQGSMIPYKSASAPEEGSIFASPLLTIGLTMQHYIGMSHQLSRELFVVLWTDLKGKPTADAQHMLKYISAKSPRLNSYDTDTAKELLLNEPEFSENLLNDDGVRVIYIIYLLNNIAYSDRTATDFPLNLQTVFHNLIGYSGTMSTVQTFPGTTSKENETKHEFPDVVMHTDSSVKESLKERMTKSSTTVISVQMPDSKGICKKSSVKKLLEAGAQGKNDVRIIIDAGAFMKDCIDNFKVARYLYEIVVKELEWPISQVWFFNSANLMMSHKGSGTPSAARTAEVQKDVLIYLDQPHTFGTDVKLKAGASGILTVNSPTTGIDDFMQAMMRMRNYLGQEAYRLTGSRDTKQQITFVVENSKNKQPKATDVWEQAQAVTTEFQKSSKYNILRRKFEAYHRYIFFKRNVYTDKDKTRYRYISLGRKGGKKKDGATEGDMAKAVKIAMDGFKISPKNVRMFKTKAKKVSSRRLINWVVRYDFDKEMDLNTELVEMRQKFNAEHGKDGYQIFIEVDMWMESLFQKSRDQFGNQVDHGAQLVDKDADKKTAAKARLTFEIEEMMTILPPPDELEKAMGKEPFQEHLKDLEARTKDALAKLTVTSDENSKQQELNTEMAPPDQSKAVPITVEVEVENGITNPLSFRDCYSDEKSIDKVKCVQVEEYIPGFKELRASVDGYLNGWNDDYGKVYKKHYMEYALWKTAHNGLLISTKDVTFKEGSTKVVAISSHEALVMNTFCKMVDEFHKDKDSARLLKFVTDGKDEPEPDPIPHDYLDHKCKQVGDKASAAGVMARKTAVCEDRRRGQHSNLNTDYLLTPGLVEYMSMPPVPGPEIRLGLKVDDISDIDQKKGVAWWSKHKCEVIQPAALPLKTDPEDDSNSGLEGKLRKFAGMSDKEKLKLPISLQRALVELLELARAPMYISDSIELDNGRRGLESDDNFAEVTKPALRARLDQIWPDDIQHPKDDDDESEGETWEDIPEVDDSLMMPDRPKKNLTAWLIFLGVAVGVVLLLMMFCICYICKKRRRRIQWERNFSMSFGAHMADDAKTVQSHMQPGHGDIEMAEFCSKPVNVNEDGEQVFDVDAETSSGNDDGVQGTTKAPISFNGAGLPRSFHMDPA